MVEGEGGSQEQVKAPETETRSAVDTVDSHLLLATVDTNFLNPDTNKVTQTQTDTLVTKGPRDLEPVIDLANKVSTKSRKEHYKDDTRDFDQQNLEWNNGFWQEVQNSINDENVPLHIRGERRIALEAVGLNLDVQAQDENGLYKQVEDFRKTYLGAESNIGEFVQDIARGCRNAQGTVDMTKLTDRLQAIEPMLVVFGKEYSADKIVDHVTRSYGFLDQDEDTKKQIAENAAQQVITPLTQEDNSDEYNTLKVLYDEHKQAQSQEVTEPLTGTEPLVMSEHSRKAWSLLMTEYPEFQKVMVINLPPDIENNPNTAAKYLHPQNEEQSPAIAIRKDFTPAIDLMRDKGQVVLDYLASRLGITPDKLTDEILQTFILIHEAGHAHDHKGLTKDEVTAKKEKSKEGLPAKNLAEFRANNPQATQEQINEFMLEYRKIPTEKAADDFAVEFFKNHPELLEPTPSTEEEATYGEVAAGKTIKNEKPFEKAHEDRMMFAPEQRSFAIFDGLGGHDGGDVAAQFAKDYFTEAVKHIPTSASIEDATRYLSRCCTELDSLIPSVTETGKTTLTFSYVHEASDGTKKLLTLSIGDSRLYRMRNNQLECITLDDADVEGSTDAKRALQDTLSELSTKEEYKALPKNVRIAFATRNEVGKAVGGSMVTEPNITLSDIEENDEYILTSDGIHDNLTDSQIQDIVNNATNTHDAVKELIERSRLAAKDTDNLRHKPDDMTAIVFQMTPDFPEKFAEKPLRESDNPDNPFTKNVDNFIENLQLITDAEQQTGRALTPAEQKFVLSGGNSENIENVENVFRALTRARRNRMYPERLDKLKEEMDELEKNGERDSDEYKNRVEEINNSKLTIGSLESLDITLLFMGVDEETRQKMIDQYNEVDTKKTPDTRTVLVAQFIKGADDVTRPHFQYLYVPTKNNT